MKMLHMLRLCFAMLLFATLLALGGSAPTQAKFLTPDTYDPWKDGVDVNRFAYGANDPINKSDPNGHDSFVAGAPYDGTYSCPGGYCGTVDGGMISGWNPLTTPNDEWHRALSMTPNERSAYFRDTTNRRERVRKAAEEAANLALQFATKGKAKRTIGANEKQIKEPRRPSAETRRRADKKAEDEDGKLKCKYCKEEMITRAGAPNSREFDHRTAYVRGGSSGPKNIDSICRTCNRGKATWSVREFVSRILNLRREK
jgi:5-methylcytosine-specific restriction endonuclease McrA